METNCSEPNPLDCGQDIKTGLDGKLYVVFPNSYALEQYMRIDPMQRYRGLQVCSFGQFENAFCLDRS